MNTIKSSLAKLKALSKLPEKAMDLEHKIVHSQNYLEHMLWYQSNQIKEQNELLLISSGKSIASNYKNKEITSLEDVEFKIFSQFGDDGIIQWLIKNLELKSRRFVEFGVEDYRESNTRFLLQASGWGGLVLDGSEENIKKIQSNGDYSFLGLESQCRFIDKDNIKEIISDFNKEGEIDLLSIDIDGNDYWIWQAIDNINPTIVIAEYNAAFGLNPWVMPYDQNYVWDKNSDYWGASLLSLCDLGHEKGYAFIGCNTMGNNAYFIKKEAALKLPIKLPEITKGYRRQQFRFVTRDKKYALENLLGHTLFNTRLKSYDIVTEENCKQLQNFSRNIKQEEHPTQDAVAVGSPGFVSLPYHHLLGPVTYSADSMITSNNCDFINEERFVKAYKAAENTKPWLDYSSNWRLHIYCWFTQMATKLSGQFVECGVHTGASAIAAMTYNNFNDLQKVFYLFDTFTGFPTEQLTNEERTLGLEDFDTAYRNVLKEVKETFKNLPAVIVPGKIPDSLVGYDNFEISFLSLDLNASYPEIKALEYFWPQMVTGAILIMDDYGFPAHTIQKNAFDDFAKTNAQSILSLPTGQAIIIKS